MKLTFFPNIIILLFLAFNVACAQNAQSKKPVIPDGWNKIEACGITFYAPPDFKEENVKGIDSCVKRYRNDNISLFLDVLKFKLEQSASRRDEYSDEKDFQIVKTNIDNRKAEIITHYAVEDLEQWKGLHYSATLFIPKMREDCCNLTIWSHSRTAEDRETARKIFETVSIGK